MEVSRYRVGVFRKRAASLVLTLSAGGQVDAEQMGLIRADPAGLSHLLGEGA